MNKPTKLGGVAVPLVTPITTDGQLDVAALDRLIEFQIAGGVQGLLLLGTTGEGPCVPRALRRPLVERAINTARQRARVYVNVAENSLADTLLDAQEYFALGVDAIAALPPFYFPPRPKELTTWYRSLLDASPGPVLMYNIPMTTRVSVPLEVIGELIGHPRFVGLKDSENDAQRHETLLNRFGGRPDFSIFVGVGSLMAKGLRSGADGIVPSVGNLIPEVCQRQVFAAQTKDWAAVDACAARQTEVASLYQKGRTLAQSLATLKGLLYLRRLCLPTVFPPLLPIEAAEMEALSGEMLELRLA
ncbi:MAG TPA: dihydrodipicolinate synthase family protein [Candidatus Paceibacterota bacterium]|nr:dihydrodipicolinate synthase family protein [Verrucomicrobiota bacterium]HRY48540.1 dihydrodipicolinate synthase family protein [Candidatus Paceibacterota bacterium]HRZ99549.1 dihydrodipicolinate synthase family protein [Candidatus Paceibacterota bacterium]